MEKKAASTAARTAAYVAKCGGAHARSTPIVDSQEKSQIKLAGIPIAATRNSRATAIDLAECFAVDDTATGRVQAEALTFSACCGTICFYLRRNLPTTDPKLDQKWGVVLYSLNKRAQADRARPLRRRATQTPNPASPSNAQLAGSGTTWAVCPAKFVALFTAIVCPGKNSA